VAGLLHGARLELGPQHEALQRELRRADARLPPQRLGRTARSSLTYFIDALGDGHKGITPLIISPAALAAPGAISYRGDASGDNHKGFGAVLGPVVLHGRFSDDCPPIEEFTILARELLVLYFLLAQFGPLLAGLTLRFGSDNDGLRSCLGTGFTHDASCAPILRAILFMCRKHSILVLTSHYYREDNTVCDDISKATSPAGLAAAIRPLVGYSFEVGEGVNPAAKKRRVA
jgi:hypothetical protein